MKRFKNILMFTGTEQNEAAVSRAFTLAMENDAKLTLMETVKPIPKSLGLLKGATDQEESERHIVAEHREQLLRRAAEYVDTDVQVDVVVTIGDPAVEITRQVVRDHHDLVIKTANGQSGLGTIFGGVARSLLRICPCPVWVLKPEVHGEFDRVLAAIDVEDQDETHRKLNQDILELAFAVAQRENAELHLVAAWELWMEKALRRRAGDKEIDSVLDIHRTRIERAIDQLLQAPLAAGDQIKVHLVQGPPARVIREVARQIEADLLVMGTLCRTKAAGFLMGNTAESVLSDVDCSLLALKPGDFVSPIDAENRSQKQWFGHETPTLHL